MEVVIALALDGDALVAGHFAGGARRLESELADGAGFGISDVPFPGGDSLPAIDLHLHIQLLIIIRNHGIGWLPWPKSNSLRRYCPIGEWALFGDVSIG